DVVIDLTPSFGVFHDRADEAVPRVHGGAGASGQRAIRVICLEGVVQDRAPPGAQRVSGPVAEDLDDGYEPVEPDLALLHGGVPVDHERDRGVEGVDTELVLPAAGCV